MKKAIVTLFAVALLFLVACTTSEPSPTATPPPATDTPVPEIAGDPDIGREIFESGGAHENYKPSNACSSCHTLDGSKDNGPSLQGISAVAGERVPGVSAAEYIRQSIMEPKAYIVEDFKAMGSINSILLSEDEVDNIVAFLLTQ